MESADGAMPFFLSAIFTYLLGSDYLYELKVSGGDSLAYCPPFCHSFVLLYSTSKFFSIINLNVHTACNSYNHYI